ncbi:hypothetical protein CIK05_09185 [Bdellovibrio sp. qaytius]|nr:hypothetical protein CIK05_09185 [Bdellovibrio sp. qaytius]
MNANTKRIALSLAVLIAANSTAFAATDRDKQLAGVVDEALLEISSETSSAQMQQSITQVEALIKNIKGLSNDSMSNKDQAFINTARLLISMLGISAGVVHFKNKDAESVAAIVTAVGAGVLSSALDAYSQHRKLDLGDLKNLLAQNQQVLADNLKNISPEATEQGEQIVQAITQIADLNNKLNENSGALQQMIDNGQVASAVVAVGTIVLNHTGSLVPKKIKDGLLAKLPEILEKTKSAAQAGKKAGVNTLASTNGMTLLSTLAGLTGPDAQNQVNTILANLEVARAKLIQASKQ